jgi:hypothetical protein
MIDFVHFLYKKFKKGQKLCVEGYCGKKSKFIEVARQT